MVQDLFYRHKTELYKHFVTLDDANIIVSYSHAIVISFVYKDGFPIHVNLSPTLPLTGGQGYK